MENVLYFASVGLIVLISLYAILKILIKKIQSRRIKSKYIRNTTRYEKY